MSRWSVLGAISALGFAAMLANAAVADIKIGLPVSATGQVAAFGEQMRRGAEAAVAAINANGGVNGEKLVLEVADDACEPKQAVAVANQFASAGIKFIIGHLCSGATLVAQDVYAEEGIVMITGSATNIEITKKNYPTIFRACGRDDQQASVSADLILNKFAGKRIAVVDDKQAFGRGLADELVKILKDAGVEPTYVGSINAGEKDYTSLISRLRDEKIDVFYYGGYYPELGLIARQGVQSGFHPQYISAESIANTEYWAVAGDAAAGTLFTYAPNPMRDPANKAIVESFKAQGSEPDNIAFYYYAAVQILAHALDLADSVDPAEVAKVLHRETFKTVVGEMAFDEKGDLRRPDYVIYEWANGAFDYAND